MIARFFLLWIVCTLLTFGWIWALSPAERQRARFWFYRGAIAAAIALVFIGAVLSLNNISGV